LIGHEEQVGHTALRFQIDAAEQQMLHAADQGVAFGEGDGVANPRPHQHGHAECGKAHHHGVEHVLRADETAVEQRQRRCHQQHQRGGHEQKRRVGRGGRG
jgi:hypothetical protein